VQTALEPILPKYPQIAGVGISHSGVINQREGKVLFWPQFVGWEDTPLKEIFEQKYGLPTFVQDEVRAMASMEHRFGQGRELRNFVFLYVGMGIGSAIYVNGGLYSGSDGLAGEMGHTTVEKDGPLCSCGNRGCLELYASAAALIARVRSELGHGVSSTLNQDIDGNLESLSIEEIAAAADANDRLSARVLSEGGGYLGTALAGVVNLLNPERIILAGKVPRSQEGIFFTSLLYNLRDRAYPQATRNLQVVVSQLGEDAAALGAALIAGEHVLKARCREMERPKPAGMGKDSTLSLQQDTRV
jgi:predicted NBD/HSP70 family sugar kinase